MGVRSEGIAGRDRGAIRAILGERSCDAIRTSRRNAAGGPFSANSRKRMPDSRFRNFDGTIDGRTRSE
jgi:hypothetical protein